MNRLFSLLHIDAVVVVFMLSSSGFQADSVFGIVRSGIESA